MCDGLHIQKRNILLVSVLLLIFCTATKAEPVRKSPAGIPAKDWKIRCGCNGSSNDLSMLPEMARNGMNSILVSMGGHMIGANGKPTYRLAGTPQLKSLNKWQKATADNGMMFFPVTEIFGTDDQKRWPLKRLYVYPDGTKTTHMPCPGDAEFWDRKFTNMYVQIARWARNKPNIPGIVVDTEMYGADRSAFLDSCFCDECREEIAAEMGIDAGTIDPKDKKMLTTYRGAFTKRLIRIFDQTRIKVHEIYPDCLLGGYLLDNLLRTPDGEEFTSPVYKAMTMAWGTADMPVLVFSESTYQAGYHAAFDTPERPLLRPTGSYVKGKRNTFGVGDRPDYINGWLNRWNNWGAHAEFVGGFWINRIPDENFAEQVYHMAKNTRGYWLYDVSSLGTGLGANLPIGKMPGRGRQAYWQAIGQGNRELDKWKRSNGRYVSPLKVRSYTVPMPAVSLDKWKRVDLPLEESPFETNNKMFRNKEVLFYIPAKFGDKVRLTVVVDSAHATKVKTDAMAIILVTPDGKVIKRHKMTAEDLIAGTEQPNGRYIARRPVRFQATETGVYGLYLKSLRYSYTLGGCSHPVYLAR